MNTISISPINQRDSKWIELSTNNKEEALMWVNSTINNSSVDYSLISESETEKYFEFKCMESLKSYIVIFRVHKTSYYQSIFDRLAPWDHTNKIEYGYYNAEISKEKVKECIEYLWTQGTFANHGQKVLCSEIKEEANYYEVHIRSLSITYGDWGLQDCVHVYDNFIYLDKNNKLISFQKSLQKELLGLQR